MLATLLAAATLGSGKKTTQAELEMQMSKHRHLATTLVRQEFRPSDFGAQRASLIQKRPSLRVLDRLPTSEKVVALTFDDGPYPGHTEKILDILDREQVKATFFLIGSRVDDAPELARETLARGHELANHSYYHPNLTWLTKEQATAELLATSWTIERHTGVKVGLGRPPGGQSNSMVDSVFAGLGLSQIRWTINPGDLSGGTYSSMITMVKKRLRPGAIILLHDYPRDTREALPVIIKHCRAQGYRFVRVGDLLN